MVERKEVKALLAEAERGERHITDSHTMAALCRAWLALEDALEVEVKASFSDGHRVGKLIATADQSMIGQRVRIVKEARGT